MLQTGKIKWNVINRFKGQKLSTGFIWRLWFYSQECSVCPSKANILNSIFHLEIVTVNWLWWTHTAKMWPSLTGLWVESVLAVVQWSRQASFYTLGGALIQLYKDLCCEWMCGLVGQGTQAWVCTVTAFNTGYLFLFVPVPGGLLLGRGLNCVNVHVWSKRAQDVSQISLWRLQSHHTTPTTSSQIS